MSKEEITKLEKEYEELSEKYDPYYRYSSDMRVYQKHSRISERMRAIKDKLNLATT